MHSHDYRSAEPFADKSVLVLGAGLSGLDIAMELANVNAKVFHSLICLTIPHYCNKASAIKSINVVFMCVGCVFL